MAFNKPVNPIRSYQYKQIIGVLKSVEAGQTAKDVCREAAISEASYNN